MEVSINEIERRKRGRGGGGLIIGAKSELERELISGGLQSDLCFCLQVEGHITAVTGGGL